MFAQPEERLFVRLTGDWRAERTAIGASEVGPGSLTLTTLATPISGKINLQAGWRAALPATADHGQILTDELDVWLLTGVWGDVGTTRIGLSGGMAILGNPLRFANQDDAPLLWASVAQPIDGGLLAGQIGGALGTSRNPARLSGSVQAAYGHPWRLGLRGEIGLTAAAADYGGGLWIERRWGCAAPPCD